MNVEMKLREKSKLEVGFYLMKIASGGLHLVQLQKQLDGTFVVLFDCPKRQKDKDWLLSNRLFDDATWSEKLSIVCVPT